MSGASVRITAECSRTASTAAATSPSRIARGDRPVLPQHLQQASSPVAPRADGRGRGATWRTGRGATSRRGRRARRPCGGGPRPTRRTPGSPCRGSHAPGARGSARTRRRPDARRRSLDRDGGLERLADELSLANGGEVDPADEGACLRVDVDEAFVGESDQGFADRRPAHAEARGHLGLGDRLTGPDRDPDDGVAQSVVDLGDDRPAAVDLRADAGRSLAPSRTGSSDGDPTSTAAAARDHARVSALHQARTPVIAWTSPWR